MATSSGGNLKLEILRDVHVGPAKTVLILLLLLRGDTKQIRFTTNQHHVNLG